MILLLPSQPGKKLQTVAVRQVKVADHHLERALGQDGLSSLAQSAGGDGRVRPLAEVLPEQFPHFAVVIYYQDSIHRLQRLGAGES